LVQDDRKLDSWHLTGQVPSPCGAACYHPINYGNQLMTWILLILSVSSVLIGNYFSFCKKKKKEKKKKEKERKKKRKRKRKRGQKELKQKPHAITVTWSYLSSMTKSF
jgi:hypothetical protein